MYDMSQLSQLPLQRQNLSPIDESRSRGGPDLESGPKKKFLCYVSSLQYTYIVTCLRYYFSSCSSLNDSIQLALSTKCFFYIIISSEGVKFISDHSTIDLMD